MRQRNEKVFGLSRTVVVLGVVSLLTDVSSEGIYPLIPLFLVEVLKTQVVVVGLIEGIANSTASILRIFSGWLSDVLGNRKWLTTTGYSLSTVAKPLLAASYSWQAVFGIRFADRLGKGIRAAPRDALIADTSPTERRGISFGFHRAMDTVGAVTGPLLAFWLLRSLAYGYRTIFLLSAIPALLAVLILIAFVRAASRTTCPRGATVTGAEGVQPAVQALPRCGNSVLGRKLVGCVPDPSSEPPGNRHRRHTSAVRPVQCSRSHALDVGWSAVRQNRTKKRDSRGIRHLCDRLCGVRARAIDITGVGTLRALRSA